MNLGLSIVLFAAVATSEGKEANQFASYSQAYREAQRTGRPLLVILNPAASSEKASEPIAFASVRKTRQRREFLQDYVVAVVDTGTSRGKTIHQLFKSPALPHVVVIDKRQRYQLFQTSEPLYGQLWTTILQTYRSGERQARPASRTSTVSRSTTGFRPAFQLQQSYQYCPT